MNSDPTIVIGAGIAGLGAAAELRQANLPYVVIEREDGPGGLVRTDQVGPYLFDRAGHYVHVRDGEFFDAMTQSGVKFEEKTRHSSVILDGALIPYPLQFNLWAATASLREAVHSELPALRRAASASGSFAEKMLASWGQALTQKFFEPYHEKLQGRTLASLPAAWGARYIPGHDLDRVETGLVQPVLNYGYNATFRYPKSGRIGDLPEALARPHRDHLRFNSTVVEVDLAKKHVRLNDGDIISYSAVISTLALPQLMSLSGLQNTPGLFAHANIVNLRVGFRGHVKRRDHWYYIPSRDVPFYRVGIPSNVNAAICPPGCASLSIELGVGEETRLDAAPASVARLALEYLGDHGILEWSEIEVIDVRLIAPAYVANRMQTTPDIAEAAKSLANDGVLVAGRFGAWDYLSIDEAFHSGVEAAREVVGQYSSRIADPAGVA